MNEEEDAVIISQNYIPKKMRAPPPPSCQSGMVGLEQEDWPYRWLFRQFPF
jgi:hypothetical protein